MLAVSLRIWDKLIQLNIVIPTRQIGRAKLFKLNEENPAVEKLIKLYDTLLYLEAKNYFTKKSQSYSQVDTVLRNEFYITNKMSHY